MRGRTLVFLALAVLIATAGTASAQGGAPGTATALAEEGKRALFTGDYYLAVERFLESYKRNPAYLDAVLGLADAYYALGEYDQALGYAMAAAKLRAGDARVSDLIGYIQLGLGDATKALASFKGVLATFPNDVDARFGLALLDLAAGRQSDAKEKYREALRISPRNAKALLSLALLCHSQGASREASTYMEEALRYHAEDPQTQYFAAYLAAQAGDRAEASYRAGLALELRPAYAEARRLLSELAYLDGDFARAIALMDEAVARDRKDERAWFTLGLAQAAAGKLKEAQYSLKTALAIRPDDEIARIGLEQTVMDATELEDAVREPLADFHFARGREFEDRSLHDQALFEYRRGLKIYPYSKKGRVLYAELLREQGFPAKQLEELRFLKSIGKADQAVLDAIEIYESLLESGAARSWGVDQFALPKRPCKMVFYYIADAGNPYHVSSDAILSRYLVDLFSRSGRIAVAGPPKRAGSFSDAFRSAREAGADYFVVIGTQETERDVQIEADLYVARTGSPAGKVSAFRTGNDRVKNTARRIASLIESSVPLRGFILSRKQELALADMGARDGVEAGARFIVLKKNAVSAKAEGMGFSWSPSDVMGAFEVLRVDEEVCEGRLTGAGFFDTINVGDELIIAPDPAKPLSAGSLVDPAWPGLYKLVGKLR